MGLATIFELMSWRLTTAVLPRPEYREQSFREYLVILGVFFRRQSFNNPPEVGLVPWAPAFTRLSIKSARAITTSS